MIQVASGRPVTAEVRVRSQARLCRIYGGQSGRRRDIALSVSVFARRYSSVHTPYSPISTCVSQRRTNGRSKRTTHTAILFRKLGSVGQKSTVTKCVKNLRRTWPMTRHTDFRIRLTIISYKFAVDQTMRNQLILTLSESNFVVFLMCITSCIHSNGLCKMRRFLAVLRSFLYSSLLCTFSCYPSPPTILPSSLTPSCHLFLGPPLNLFVPKFIHNTLLGILLSSILCTCQNQRNLNFTVSPCILIHQVLFTPTNALFHTITMDDKTF